MDEKSTALKLDNLKAKMKSTLRMDQFSELSKQISPADYFDETRCVDYLQTWESEARKCLGQELEKVVTKSIEWKKGCLGIPVTTSKRFFITVPLHFQKEIASLAGKNWCKEPWMLSQRSTTTTKPQLMKTTLCFLVLLSHLLGDQVVGRPR
jgi:hypothetical protein